jgi:hypothetical protein
MPSFTITKDERNCIELQRVGKPHQLLMREFDWLCFDGERRCLSYKSSLSGRFFPQQKSIPFQESAPRAASWTALRRSSRLIPNARRSISRGLCHQRTLDPSVDQRPGPERRGARLLISGGAGGREAGRGARLPHRGEHLLAPGHPTAEQQRRCQI